MAVIEATGLTKRYGPVTAVDRLSFTVGEGQVAGFLGPNGAGKTTALKMLLGLARPDSGTATIRGRSYTDLASPSAQVGAAFEASGFHPGRTARNHLRVQALAAGLDVVQPYLPYTAATTLAGSSLGGAAFGPAHGAVSGSRPRPFAAAAALLAAVCVLVDVLAARTTVGADIS